MPHAQRYPAKGQAISALKTNHQSGFPWQVQKCANTVRKPTMLPHLSTPLRAMKDRLPRLRNLSHFLRCRLNTQDLKLSNIGISPFANVKSVNLD
jgi:hypothetical protein